jgi:dihydropteroate synthase
LRQPGAREAVAAHPSCGICLMHMHRDPQTMQVAPMQGAVVPEVLAFWAQQVAQLRLLQINPSRITLDPGIGFGKTVAQNFALLARQRDLLEAGYPLLLGWSRKSSIGTVSGIPAAAERLVPSVTAAMLAVDRGAAIVRVHDVRDTVAALAVWQAMKAQEPQAGAPASINQQKRQTS